MKTKIAIATTSILLTGYGLCFAPDNNLPKGLKSYHIADLTKSKWIKEQKEIKIKRAMKYESKNRLQRLETLNVFN